MKDSNLLSFCQEFLKIDSTNPHGTWELAQFLRGPLEALGFEVKWQRARFCGAPQANVIARKGPRKGRPLVFNTHLDTVVTHAPAWTCTGGDPFRPTIRGRRLYGLGAADTKLALACQIIALQKFTDRVPQRPLYLTGTYGEEMGLIGVQRLIRLRELHGAQVLNSEPTELKVALGNKGFRVFQLSIAPGVMRREQGQVYEICFTGQAGHSAFPEEGKNANRAFLDWYFRHGKQVRVLEVEGGQAPNIIAPCCRVKILLTQGALTGLQSHSAEIVKNIGVQSERVSLRIGFWLLALRKFLCLTQTGGSQTHNLGQLRVDSKRGVAVLDHRFPPEINPVIRERRLVKFFQAQDKELQGSVLVEKVKDNGAFRSSPHSAWLRQIQETLQEMNRSSEAFLKPGCTEAAHFASVGCEVLILGPGRNYGNIHRPNECVELSQLKAAVQFYRRLLEKTCFGATS